MEDKESGSLSQKPTLDLIIELYRGAVTGSLKLERAPLQKAVYFRDGQILFAASNDPKDQLASILVEEGKLGTRPDASRASARLGGKPTRESSDRARLHLSARARRCCTYQGREDSHRPLHVGRKARINSRRSRSRKAPSISIYPRPQFIYASIGRIQDRDWILRELGSLDAVLAAGPTLDVFIRETKADDQASEVLRQADGVKSVTQIGALSSLGEFEVCKVLAAGLVAGALTKAGDAVVPGPVAAPDDAFSIPSEPPTFDPAPSSAEVPFGRRGNGGSRNQPASLTGK